MLLKFFSNKILYRIISALLVFSLSFYAVMVRPDGVLAADAEVTTLPAFIDIIVDYDADTVFVTYDNQTFSIDRNYKLTDSDNMLKYYSLFSSSKVGSDVVLSSRDVSVKGSHNEWFPFSLELTVNGDMVNTCYWFSPSAQCIYVLSGSYGSRALNGIQSYSDGSFKTATFYGTAYSYYLYLSVFDSSSSLVGLCSYYGAGVYSTCALNGIVSSLPDDLICVFSNYSISGFYEPDVSNVNTPDYYFNFQYIFYLKDSGYTFVDSAQKLTEIGFPSNVNNARYIFENSCNFYVYTSIDGITWIKKTDVSTMYNSYFDVDYGVAFAGCYELVYTNDDSFGVSLNEWISLPDVLDDLSTFHSHYDPTIGIEVYDPFLSDEEVSAASRNAFRDLILSFTGDFSGISSSFDVLENLEDDLYSNFIDDTSLIYLKYLFESLNSQDTFSYVRYDETTGLYQKVTQSSIRYLLQTLLEYNVDSTTYLQAIRSELFTYFSAVNDNLSLLYDNSNSSLSYLKKLLSAFDNFSIPDYSGKLDDIYDYQINILQQLVRSDISGQFDGSIHWMSKLDDRLVTLDDDIALLYEQLYSLNYQMFGDSSSLLSPVAMYALDDDISSGFVSFSDSILSIFTDTTSGYFDSLDDSLSEVFDDFCSLFSGIGDDEDDSLWDGIDIDFDESLEILVGIARQWFSSSAFSSMLVFSSSVTNGIGFVNEIVEDVYYSLGEHFTPLIMLGVGFTVISIVLRKERAR